MTTQPSSPPPRFKPAGERAGREPAPSASPGRGGTKLASKGSQRPFSPPRREEMEAQGQECPWELGAEQCQSILPSPWKPGLAEVDACADEVLAGVEQEGLENQVLKCWDCLRQKTGRLGSWFLLQESQLFLASQQELLECCVCGLENGAIVSTGPPPSACSSADLQSGPCPLPAARGSPSGLGGEERQGHFAFWGEAGPSPHHNSTHTKPAGPGLDGGVWSQPPGHPSPCFHWKPVQGRLIGTSRSTSWGHLFIPAPHKKSRPSRPACIRLPLALVLTPCRASEVGDPCTQPMQVSWGWGL